MKIITVEEHFVSKKVNDEYIKYMQPKNEQEKQQFDFVNMTIEKGPLSSLGEDRIAFMDKNGISTQIIGYGNNSPMHLSKEQRGVELCKMANDELYEATSINVINYLDFLTGKVST